MFLSVVLIVLVFVGLGRRCVFVVVVVCMD